jgi:SNF2 family DNA or RNA helicase
VQQKWYISICQRCSFTDYLFADAIVPESSIGQHRALIFCQWKATVDLICTYLQDGDIGDNISFLRLDGTTPIAQRQSIVDRFNDDATIDILVLTTHV